MHTLKVIAGIAVSGLILAGCESTSDDDDTTTAQASLRVLHASPDAPAVNVYLNDAMTPAVDTLDYGSASAFASVDAGTYGTEVYGILPGGADTDDAVIDADLTLEEDMEYTVVAVNPLASISAKVFADDGSMQDSTKVRVQVAHLAPDAPTVDVHVTAPGATLDGNSVLGTVDFADTDTLGPVLVDEGTYQIRVTAQGGTTPVYDSGSVELAAGSDLFIGAIPNVSGIGDSPISLSVSDGTTTSILYDTEDGAAVRAVHNAEDAGEVDIFAAADSTENLDVADFSDGNALFNNVTYTGVSNYAEVGAGDYDVAVSTDNATAAISAEGVTLANGMSYTVFAMGTADTNDDADLELVPYADDRRAIATAAKIRIIHGSAATADVDLYATAGTDITNENPAFEDVAYKDSTGFIELAAGTYNFTVTPANDKTIAVQEALTLEAGEIYTVWARDNGAAVELGVQDDSN